MSSEWLKSLSDVKKKKNVYIYDTSISYLSLIIDSI